MTNGEKKRLKLRVEEEVRAAFKALSKVVSTDHPEIGVRIPLKVVSTNPEARLFGDRVLEELKVKGATLYERRRNGMTEYYMVANPNSNFVKIPEGFEPVIFE